VSIKTAVYAALKPVGSTWPVLAPAGTKPPYIRYTGIGGRDEASYEGDGLGATSGILQIDIFALDYASADRLAQSARQALYASPTVTVGQITDLPDDYEVDTKLFKVSFQIEAWE
jgi:hypothetical protein